MMIPETNKERLEYLISMGDFYPLAIKFSAEVLKKQMALQKNFWASYNPRKPHFRRYGLSLFSLDGDPSGQIDLDSLREYNIENNTQYNELSFKTPTPIWHSITEISNPLNPIEPSLCRSHLIHLPEGGFFPPHRDLGPTFRLIAFFECDADSLYFILDEKKVVFTPHQLYFANTRKTHSLFSFTPNAIILVLNVEPTEYAFEFCAANTLHK